MLKQLVAKADVLCENFRPGTLEKWDLGWDVLSSVNPKLVMLRVSGYGQTGPYSEQPGFGRIGNAFGGISFLAGDPDRPPATPGSATLADYMSGLYGALGVVMALRSAEATGVGQQVDIGLYEPIFRILDDQGDPRKILIKDILLDAFDRINERMENDEVISGIPTGFSDLDQKLNGLQPSELVVLAARPSMGKTALVCNIAEGVAMGGENRGVLLFSLEQSNLELAERLLCIRSQVNSHRLRASTLDDDERKLLVLSLIHI